MNVVDTNILFYSHDPRDPVKQAVASSLIASLRPGVLLWQVVCEFVASSRKLEPYATTASKPSAASGKFAARGVSCFPIGEHLTVPQTSC